MAAFNNVTLVDLRIRAGLDAADSSKDTELQASFDAAISVLEDYLDRYLEYGAQTDRLTHFSGSEYTVSRYPIESITSVTGDSGWGLENHTDYKAGIIKFDSYLHDHVLTFDYIGGFEELPAALTAIAYLVFDGMYAILNSSGSQNVATGAVKTVRAGDLSITYETGGSGGSVSLAGSSYGLIPDEALGLLNLYRRMEA